MAVSVKISEVFRKYYTSLVVINWCEIGKSRLAKEIWQSKFDLMQNLTEATNETWLNLESIKFDSNYETEDKKNINFVWGYPKIIDPYKRHFF